MRPSNHIEPEGVVATTRHYIRDLIYGPTTASSRRSAVVAGVTGGALSTRAVLIVGAANLLADGLSMGVGNYLSIRSHESALAAENRPEEESQPARHGVATFLAFLIAGCMPQVPYAAGASEHLRFTVSSVVTFGTLFAVGASRAAITTVRWWTGGLEMLSLGFAVAAAAYGSGAFTAWFLNR